MPYSAAPRRPGLRRTLMACAGTFFVAFAAGGALFAWVGHRAVLDATRTEEQKVAETVLRAELVSHARSAGIAARGVLGHVEATARSLAADASRALVSFDPTPEVVAAATDDGSRPGATEWVPAAERGVYVLRRAGTPEIAALDAWAGALRSAVAPGGGIARAALRLDCGVEVGAPASIAVFAANDQAADARLRRTLAADSERPDAGWSATGFLPPELTFAAPVVNGAGARVGTILCEPDGAILSAALEGAAARLGGACPVLISEGGRVIGSAGDTSRLVPLDVDSALSSVVNATVQGLIPEDGTVSVGGTISSGLIRLPGTPFTIGVLRPFEARVHDAGPIEAAARNLAIGVVAVTLVFGLVLLWGAHRLGSLHDSRMADLQATAHAHTRGDYTRQAPAAGDDDLSELAAWLNTAALRLRHSISRADECDRRLTSLVESMADGFLITNAEDRITFVNQRFCELVGRPSQQILGKYVEEFLLPESLQRYRTEASRRREKRPSRYEVQWNGSRGSHPRTIVSGVPLFDEEGRITGSYGVITDITEKVRAHEQTARAEKVRALGEMAGGVAHDFNNIFTVILGNAQYLMLDGIDDDVRQTLRTIERAALDGTETVRRIREFSKNRTAAISAVPLDPNKVIADVVAAMRKRFEEDGRARDVVYQVEVLRRSRRRVRANEQELREAITQVIQNAIEAMPKGGKLIVEVFDRGEDAVAIRIEDTGCGMTPEQVQNMFDPFFTTKQGGRCSGLGLSITYGIVRAHQGHISARSDPGHGTTVTIVLPSEVSVSLSRTSVTGSPARKAEEPRVLYVTTPAGEAFSRELQAVGLNVATMNSPSSALGLVADAGIFNTLLVEYELAGTTGWELARQARGVRKNIRILLLTDSAHPMDATQARNAGIDRVLTRPFDAREVHGEIFSSLVAAPARRAADVRVPRRGATAPRLPRVATGEASTSEIWDTRGNAVLPPAISDEANAPFVDPETEDGAQAEHFEDFATTQVLPVVLTTLHADGVLGSATPDRPTPEAITEPIQDASTHISGDRTP